MPWFTLKCRVLLRKKSQTSGSRIKFPIKIPLPSPIWAKRIRLLRHKRDVYFVYIDLRAAQAGISGWLYTGVDVVGVVCVSAFYFEAISLRRRLLIPRSGQIANCCRGMKESQINGLGVPVREIKLILASARLFLMRKVNPERKRESEFASWVVGRSDTKASESIPPQMLPAKLQNQRARRSNFIKSHQRVVWQLKKSAGPSQVSFCEHQQVFRCASPRWLMAIWPRTKPLSRSSRPKQNFTCVRSDVKGFCAGIKDGCCVYHRLSKLDAHAAGDS